MKTKEQFEKQVSRFGKFEGEKAWTAYFWDLVMNGDGETVYRDDAGGAEELEIDYDKFRIDGTDAEIFGELEAFIGCEIRVWEDSQGFVMSKIIGK